MHYQSLNLCYRFDYQFAQLAPHIVPQFSQNRCRLRSQRDFLPDFVPQSVRLVHSVGLG